MEMRTSPRLRAPPARARRPRRARPVVARAAVRPATGAATGWRASAPSARLARARLARPRGLGGGKQTKFEQKRENLISKQLKQSQFRVGAQHGREKDAQIKMSANQRASADLCLAWPARPTGRIMIRGRRIAKCRDAFGRIRAT